MRRVHSKPASVIVDRCRFERYNPHRGRSPHGQHQRRRPTRRGLAADRLQLPEQPRHRQADHPRPRHRGHRRTRLHPQRVGTASAHPTQQHHRHRHRARGLLAHLRPPAARPGHRGRGAQHPRHAVQDRLQTGRDPPVRRADPRRRRGLVRPDRHLARRPAHPLAHRAPPDLRAVRTPLGPARHARPAGPLGGCGRPPRHRRHDQAPDPPRAQTHRVHRLARHLRHRTRPVAGLARHTAGRADGAPRRA